MNFCIDNVEQNIEMSLLKTRVTHLRESYSPGSFATSNSSQNANIYQKLSVVNASDSRCMPYEVRNILLCGSNSKTQVVSVATFKHVMELCIEVLLLR